MALKQRMSVMVDETLGAMNMPTRSELRTLQDRVQETRRENKRLRRELDALKRELGQQPGQRSSLPPRKRRSSRVRRPPPRLPTADVSPGGGRQRLALAAAAAHPAAALAMTRPRAP
jgi:hypothetical protein